PGSARLGDRYGFVSIALDSSRGGRAVIFYRVPNGYGYARIAAATRDAGSWTDTVLQAESSTSYGAWFYGGLAIDSGGNARFSYSDAYAGGPRIGSWPG